MASSLPSLPSTPPSTNPDISLLLSQDHTHFTMLKPASIFDIPLLLDMICDMLDPQDIGNCASCNKKWHSFFGPYRFQSINIKSLYSARVAFLLNNSHHIRDLAINLSYFDTFVDANCNRLQDLTLRFVYKDDEESDRDEPDDVELDEADPPGASDLSAPRINKPVGAAKLIQGSQSLRALHFSGEGVYYSNDARTITMPILEAIRNHTHLAKVKVTLQMTCRTLVNLLNHLPQQLQELDVASLLPVRYHSHCDHQIRMFKSCTSALRLRRLIFSHNSSCFAERMFIPLLERCPELEELRLPISDGSYISQETLTGIVEALDSNCKNLQTLNQESCQNIGPIGTILKEFSKGFRQLLLNCEQIYGSQGNRGILGTLLTTASVNTLEVLRYSLREDDEEHIIGILKHCPQLRVFHVDDTRYNNRSIEGADLSDLLLSMDQPWKCWDTLEELQLKIVNKKAVQGHARAKPRLRKTAQDTREICLRLRTLPRLTTLAIDWKLRTTWDRGTDMNLTLDDLNEGAAKSGSAVLTKEDAEWAGLKLDEPKTKTLPWAL
ncbi:MAG: hypothetical protein J3Q66DRAFT_384113, partial [Benniella sp.]